LRESGECPLLSKVLETMSGEGNISIFLVFFAALLVVVLVLSKYLHDQSVLSSIMPEAAMVLAVGMVAGFVIHVIVGKRLTAAQDDDDADDQEDVDVDLSALLSFSPEIFFIALLPPIIFNSGLRIGALFFRHIGPICCFAILGTTISALSTAFILKFICDAGLCGDFNPSLTELLTFGALISSTDPVSTLAVFQAKKVDPQLFYLVFGESVLNDALAIVLFDSFSRYVATDNANGSIALGFEQFFLDLFMNSIGSLFLGTVSGLCTALLFKQIDMRHNRLVEICVYLLLMYIPFLLAEILHLSGIVTVLFTGVAANRYVVPNLSAITKVNADMLFRVLAHLAETAIFLELGLSVFGLLGHWNWSLIGWSLVATLVARALNVYPIALLFNRFLLRDNLSSEDAMFIDHIKQFKVDISSRQGELSENFGPDAQLDFDEGIMVTKRTQSFSEQSAVSDMTATPFHKKDLKIRPNTLHMLFFTGLRGAVAYACARTFPESSEYKPDFIMTTMALVLITVFLFGGTTEAVLNLLNINIGVDEEAYMRQSLREPVVSSCIINFDNNYIRPFVIRDFKILNALPDPEKHASAGRRPRTPIDPTIEITESGYLGGLGGTDGRGGGLGSCQDYGGLEKLVRQDSLFDYGAH
jgi:NhaP-type Na+/H+ or K+/H+ antiporter